jgi:malate dehydrogenase (oxaloacetate-decarboxylating)
MPDPSTLHVALRGDAILTRPRFNKGTAFTLSERKSLGLTGRLPWKINTLEEQCLRAYDQLRSREEPIRKNTFLQSLKDQNWVLYYALLSRHLHELVPIIYTPTEVRLLFYHDDLCINPYCDIHLSNDRLTRSPTIPTFSEEARDCI